MTFSLRKGSGIVFVISAFASMGVPKLVQWLLPITLPDDGAITSSNATSPLVATLYGKSACPCIGIDKLKGYYAARINHFMAQYPVEAGASCDAWDVGRHPACKDDSAPDWCKTKWCYVDPCLCDLATPLQSSELGVEYHGSAASWSYDTCNSSYSDSEAPVTDSEDADNEASTEVSQPCNDADIDESIYGLKDCRCVGLGGTFPGKALLYTNSSFRKIGYPTHVGSSCWAWDMDTHPDCVTADGNEPSWCSQEWCFVDPCKCRTTTPPQIVMKVNGNLKFQGKTAYWSTETCGGSVDTWSRVHEQEYCVGQTSEESCDALERCAWTDAAVCVGRSFAELCPEQQRTGLLALEPPPFDSMGKRFCGELRQETEDLTSVVVHFVVRLLCSRY